MKIAYSIGDVCLKGKKEKRKKKKRFIQRPRAFFFFTLNERILSKDFSCNSNGRNRSKIKVKHCLVFVFEKSMFQSCTSYLQKTRAHIIISKSFVPSNRSIYFVSVAIGCNV
jgi:hypothetical protein